MTTLGLIQLLFISLAIVMAGLGLSLRIADFAGLLTRRREVAVALVLQMVLLPLVSYAIAVSFGLSGALAAGMLIIAATPGSISANLFSHLFGGNVAFNIALTGLNTLLCAFTLPLVTAWAVQHFTGKGESIPLLWEKASETIAVVVVPVVAGMVVAAKRPRLAEALSRPVKILSALLVVVFSLVAIVREWTTLRAAFVDIGLAVLTFNLVSITAGFLLGRLLARDRADAVTIMFQASIHSAILGIYVALAVLESETLALPAALYSITMNFIALGFGFMVLRRSPSPQLR
jgi:BASS family bile acid:Na+ symporter